MLMGHPSQKENYLDTQCTPICIYANYRQQHLPNQ